MVLRIPGRKMILEHDNAPYNHGSDVQIQSCSKEECAELLRKAGVTTVACRHLHLDNKTETPMNSEVPAVGSKWCKQGKDCMPNTRDVRNGTLAVHKEKYPWCLRPPYL
jgi:hypothetical protein